MILHLISARKYVGEAARVVDLASAQNEAGRETMLLARAGYPVAEEAKRRGVPVTLARFGSRFHPWRDREDVKRIRALLRERAVDILHVHRSKEHWLAAWACLGMKPRPLLVRTRHVVTPIRQHLFNRWLYTRATDGIIAASYAVDEALRRRFGWCATPVTVVQGGVRKNVLRPAPPEAVDRLRAKLCIEPDQPVIAMLARINEVKGHLPTIRALPELLARHPRAVVIFAYPRQGVYRSVLEGELAKLNCRHAVRWLGYQEDPAPLMTLTDIGLVASVGSEGWSRVAVEFQHLGRPVVATRAGSLPEIVRDGETGLVVPPDDPEALALALGRLLADETFRKDCGEAARARAARFCHQRMSAEVLAFYDELRSKRAR